MCIIAFRWQPDSSEPLLLAANRDEFFARPTAPLAWWPGDAILAGRDLVGGGTWLGVSRTGRFACLTNIRDPSLRKANAPSRGLLVNAFLEGSDAPKNYLSALAQKASQYEGYNLICGTLGKKARSLYSLHSASGFVEKLTYGVHTLSNAALDTPWPKTERLRGGFVDALATPTDTFTQLYALLRDSHRAADEELPRTGVPLEWERSLSRIFIRREDEQRALIYGTRCSTILQVSGNTVTIQETSFFANGASSSAKEAFELI